MRSSCGKYVMDVAIYLRLGTIVISAIKAHFWQKKKKAHIVFSLYKYSLFCFINFPVFEIKALLPKCKAMNSEFWGFSLFKI